MIKEKIAKHRGHRIITVQRGGEKSYALECEDCGVFISESPKIAEHYGHHIVAVMYGNKVNYALECEDCYEVLADEKGPNAFKLKGEA